MSTRASGILPLHTDLETSDTALHSSRANLSGGTTDSSHSRSSSPGRLQGRKIMAGGGDHPSVPHERLAPSKVINSAWLAATQLMFQTIVTKTLACLLHLNVFEALAAAGEGALLTAEELAQLAKPGKPINVRYLERMLQLLSSQQILSEVVTAGGEGDGERRFGMTPIGKFYVKDAENGSLIGTLDWLLCPPILSCWDTLDEYMVDDTRSAFARANGGLDFWEFRQRNPEFNEKFDKVLVEQEKVFMRAVLDAYQGFEEVKVLVDVGGGSGSSLSYIIGMHPHIKGINFDQPHIIDGCPEIPGVRHVGGDFLESVPAGADTIFMKFVLHNWGDDNSLRILKNCFEALPVDGKVIIVDNILPERGIVDDGDRVGRLYDVLMLVLFGANARERTESEVRKLALDAGFRRCNIVCKADHLSVAELRKT